MLRIVLIDSDRVNARRAWVSMRQGCLTSAYHGRGVGLCPVKIVIQRSQQRLQIDTLRGGNAGEGLLRAATGRVAAVIASSLRSYGPLTKCDRRQQLGQRGLRLWRVRTFFCPVMRAAPRASPRARDVTVAGGSLQSVQLVTGDMSRQT